MARRVRARWRRIRVYFDAYGEASRTDAGVADTILPNSYAVTAHMRRFLARFEGAELAMAHDKLVLLFNDLDQLMHVTSLMNNATESRRMLEAFTDLHWRGLFQPASQQLASRHRVECPSRGQSAPSLTPIR